MQVEIGCQHFASQVHRFLLAVRVSCCPFQLSQADAGFVVETVSVVQLASLYRYEIEKMFVSPAPLLV